MKINNFRGDLTDNLAKKEALEITRNLDYVTLNICILIFIKVYTEDL